MPVPARVALAAFAVLACAWFVVATVQVHDQARATALLAQPGTPSTALTNRILHLLDTAGTLNPDRQVDLLRVQALQRGGRSAAALRTALAVVHDEPKNVFAWVVLGFAAVRDPALARLATERERQLAPPVPAAP